MRVITEERLLNTLFSEIQSVALANGTCHYEGYKNWCISGEEVEQAIKNIFVQNDLFKPTVDIVLCKDCKHYSHCESCYVWHTDPNPEDFAVGEKRKTPAKSILTMKRRTDNERKAD